MRNLKLWEFSEFIENFEANKNLFEKASSFYCANDKEQTGYKHSVFMGCMNGQRYDCFLSGMTFCSCVAYLEMPEESKDYFSNYYGTQREKIEKVQNAFANAENGLISFKLTNGEQAYISLAKINGREVIGLVIPNESRNMDFHFSNEGSSYNEAKKQKGTLPYMIEKGLLISYLPNEIIDFLDLAEEKKCVEEKKLEIAGDEIKANQESNEDVDGILKNFDTILNNAKKPGIQRLFEKVKNIFKGK